MNYSMSFGIKKNVIVKFFRIEMNPKEPCRFRFASITSQFRNSYVQKSNLDCFFLKKPDKGLAYLGKYVFLYFNLFY